MRCTSQRSAREPSDLPPLPQARPRKAVFTFLLTRFGLVGCEEICRDGFSFVQLKALQAQLAQDKKDVAFQRMAWDALRKSINGLINKVRSLHHSIRS